MLCRNKFRHLCPVDVHSISMVQWSPRTLPSTIQPFSENRLETVHQNVLSYFLWSTEWTNNIISSYSVSLNVRRLCRAFTFSYSIDKTCTFRHDSWNMWEIFFSSLDQKRETYQHIEQHDGTFLRLQTKCSEVGNGKTKAIQSWRLYFVSFVVRCHKHFFIPCLFICLIYFTMALYTFFSLKIPV